MIDLNRPITDYEVEFKGKYHSMTYGKKYQIQEDKGTCWVVKDNYLDYEHLLKTSFHEPTLRADAIDPPNPDIDLLDKLVIGMVTGIYADPQAGDINEQGADNLYIVAARIVNARKKYLTIKPTDSE